jgi:hypothetical protein
MDINQNILKNSMNKIISLIKDIILQKSSKDLKDFFPKNKNFFYNYILKLNELYKNNNKILESLIFYKSNGYIIINKILIYGKFPYILSYPHIEYNLNLKSHKTQLNTQSLYIFPDDVDRIKRYHQNKILNHIKNLDNILNKDFCKLSDCILFRGISSELNLNSLTNIDDTKLYNLLHDYQKKSKITFNNKDDYLFKNYSSFSFNPNMALKFLQKTSKFKSYFLILNIKKEHNIPGFFLSDLFFFANKNNDINITKYNSINYDEIEILISRNLHIKILKITKLKFKDNIFSSIKNIYNDNLDKEYSIDIIYAESLPFEQPPELNIEGYKYLCI